MRDDLPRNPSEESESIVDFRSLALQAATIDEVLSNEFLSEPGEKASSDLAALRLAAWCRASASGDWLMFTRRLARDGLTLEHVLSQFSQVRRNPTAPSPGWLGDGAWIVRAVGRQSSPPAVEHLLERENPLPFQDLLLPIVEEAERILGEELPPEFGRIMSPRARRQLCHLLLSSLSGLSAEGLYQEFRNWSALAKAPSAAVESRLLDYSDFIDYMRRGGFDRLVVEKPVMLRLIASVTRQWIEFTSELAARLADDFSELTTEFPGGSPQRLVDSIVGNLSDIHNFGRSVLILGFSDGTQLVYKPKDIRLDAFWFDLVSWINKLDAPALLKVPRVLPRDGYGWSEFIEYSDCADRDEVGLFYFRAGAWLALLHVFGGTDMHQENLIAAGSHPVPIDLEMLFSSRDLRAHPSCKGSSLDLALQRVSDSVSMVGLLPSYTRNLRNEVFALGGLDHAPGVTETVWKHTNSSRMERGASAGGGARPANIPHLNGSPVAPAEFSPAVVDGFVAYSQFLLQCKGSLLSEWLDKVPRNLPSRSILRSTQFYQLLLRRLRDPKNMADGVIWSADLDFAARFADLTERDIRAWPLMRAERNALAELNVPMFRVPIGGGVVSDHTGIEAQVDLESGLDRARRRLEKWDRKEIAWQTDVVRASTATPRARDGAGSSVAAVPTKRSQMGDGESRQLCLEVADEIALELKRLAIRSENDAAWVGMHWFSGSEACQLKALGFDLYDGVGGIALFLAGHARTTSNLESEALAVEGLSVLRANIRGANSRRFSRTLGLGGCTGLGSIIYALSVVGSLLEERKADLMDDALAAARLVSAELLTGDRGLDVVSGSAGCILGLLKLFRETGKAEVLESAVKCGEHLLRMRRVGTASKGLWLGMGLGDRALTGMAHGAAGFAYAFASLHAEVGRDEFIEAAMACLEFERSAFSEARGNWPDFRKQTSTSPEAWSSQWCHGAAGIGLARIGMLKRAFANSDAIISEVRAALACAMRSFPCAVDTMCCGSLGNIELLNEGGLFLRSAVLRSEATRRMTEVLCSAKDSGDYRWEAGERKFNLGMFKGIAGIGYSALRQVNNTLPSILIWE